MRRGHRRLTVLFERLFTFALKKTASRRIFLPLTVRMCAEPVISWLRREKLNSLLLRKGIIAYFIVYNILGFCSGRTCIL